MNKVIETSFINESIGRVSLSRCLQFHHLSGPIFRLRLKVLPSGTWLKDLEEIGPYVSNWDMKPPGKEGYIFEFLNIKE